MSQEPRDDLAFGRFLKQGDAELDRAYGALDHESPPTALDERIRAAAHRQARGRRSPPMRRWLPGLTVAATLVLSFGLVQLVSETQRETAPLPAKALEEAAEQVTSETRALKKAPHTQVDPSTAEQAGDARLSAPLPATPSPAVPQEMKKRALKTIPRAQMAPMREASEVPALEDWLQRIEALLAQGEQARARLELKRLLEHYPEAHLPPPLRKLADEDPPH